MQLNEIKDLISKDTSVKVNGTSLNQLRGLLPYLNDKRYSCKIDLSKENCIAVYVEIGNKSLSISYISDSFVLFSFRNGISTVRGNFGLNKNTQSTSDILKLLN